LLVVATLLQPWHLHRRLHPSRQIRKRVQRLRAVRLQLWHVYWGHSLPLYLMHEYHHPVFLEWHMCRAVPCWYFCRDGRWEPSMHQLPFFMQRVLGCWLDGLRDMPLNRHTLL
jgi:hypothetical protein